METVISTIFICFLLYNNYCCVCCNYYGPLSLFVMGGGGGGGLICEHWQFTPVEVFLEL